MDTTRMMFTLVLMSITSIVAVIQCPDKVGCLCSRHLIVCRQVNSLPGRLSLSSYPLNRYALKAADLRKSYVTLPALKAFAKQFKASLIKIDIRWNANRLMDCGKLERWRHEHPTIRVISDCHTDSGKY